MSSNGLKHAAPIKPSMKVYWNTNLNLMYEFFSYFKYWNSIFFYFLESVEDFRMKLIINISKKIYPEKLFETCLVWFEDWSKYAFTLFNQ